MPRAPQVVTVGHAIVDVLSPVADEVVAGLGLDKGTMTLVDDATATEINDRFAEPTAVSGGSAANTAVGLAALGTATAFVGKVADDRFGSVFASDIRAAGVSFDVPPGPVGEGRAGTGRCMVMVTPDAEKTMCTYLGV
ncbi:MAG TPA: PfkB family carbohydrate kinase, partial [Acidimicrobiales bacterium]|nr:PfkB family carbohydrate kinase [Acidimicrobiales bacterium]